MKPTTEDLESVGVSAEVVSVTVVPMADGQQSMFTFMVGRDRLAEADLLVTALVKSGVKREDITACNGGNGSSILVYRK